VKKLHRIRVCSTDFGEIAFVLRVKAAYPAETQMFFLDRAQAAWFARDLALAVKELPERGSKAEEQAIIKSALELVADLDHKE